MLQSENHTIDGHSYRVTQLPFKKGQKLLVRLYKTLGPAVAEIFGALPAFKDGQKLDEVKVTGLLPSISSGMAVLAERLSEEDLEYVTDLLAEYTQLGKGGDKWVPLAKEMELHFSGRYGAYMKWLGAALKTNYSGFFVDSAALKGLLARVAERGSPSPSTSTGTPTESPPANATAPA